MSLYGPLMFIVGDVVLKYQTVGEIQQRVGNGTGSAFPRGVYQTLDGHWLVIAASNQVIAQRLFAPMGEPELIEDPLYATNAARMERNDERQEKVSAWVGSRPRDDVLMVLDALEVVASPANDARDIVENPHFLTRTLVDLSGNDVLGRILVPSPILHLRSYDGPRYVGVPSIGEHTGEVLSDVAGVTEPELVELASARVISG